MMFQRCGGNDAIVGLLDCRALFAQLAINIVGSNAYSFRHGQHNQGAKIAPDPPVGGVIGNALRTFFLFLAPLSSHERLVIKHLDVKTS